MLHRIRRTTSIRPHALLKTEQIGWIVFLLDQTQERARELLLCSIVYLPTVLLTITWDHYRLLS